MSLRLRAGGDGTGGDAEPAAVALLVGVRVEGFLPRAVGQHRVRGATVDQGDIAEQPHPRLQQLEVFERARLGDVHEVLVPVPSDTRRLHDEVLGEELAEALSVAGLVGVVVVEVQLLEDRQVFVGLLVHSVSFSLRVPHDVQLTSSSMNGDGTGCWPVAPSNTAQCWASTAPIRAASKASCRSSYSATEATLARAAPASSS